jgi:peroxiredoxin
MKKLCFLTIIIISFFASNAIAQSSSLKVGQPAPEISLPQPNGKTLSLSSLRGEIVLVDFWATWCGPCLKEQPELKKIYLKHFQSVKDGKFQILGVSLDSKKDHWEKGIKRLGIIWPQVSDLKFWESKAAKDYGLKKLPYNVVVSKKGKIIATDLHGKKLQILINKLLQ